MHGSRARTWKEKDALSRGSLAQICTTLSLLVSSATCVLGPVGLQEDLGGGITPLPRDDSPKGPLWDQPALLLPPSTLQRVLPSLGQACSIREGSGKDKAERNSGVVLFR